jgi:alkylated DNA repair dioxygenase AlkB
MTGTAPDGFVFVPEFLGADEQGALLWQLRDQDYEHDIFRGRRLKRSYAQFGYAYGSTGRRLTAAAPLPEFLTALIEKARPHHPAGHSFNQCIVTHYPPGAGIGWHTDAPRFGDCILAVSLGAEARLQFRVNGTQEVCCEVRASPGSLYVMQGPARREYQHRVAPVGSTRYSLTFRHVDEKHLTEN